MPRKSDNWSTISLHPLSGPLDLRSNPTEIAPGAWRYKLNAEVTKDGRMKRRAGFGLPWSDKLYDNSGRLLSDYGPEEEPYTGQIFLHNHDHRRQGAAVREQIVFLHECTRDDGNRYLFDGTQSRLSVLNEATGLWTDLATGKGAYGSRWKCAQLQNVLYFTNDVDNILSLDLSGLDDYATVAATVSEVTELKTEMKITAAKVVIQYLGFIILMNVVKDGERRSTMVAWSDENDGMEWSIGDPSLAGYQELTYGDDILGAAQMHGQVYIYTRRGIWKMWPSGDETTQFLFSQVYSEPLNQKGCLFYPETLISTGAEHWYMSRDSICRFDPYIPAPEIPDWLDMSSVAIFNTPATAMNGTRCSLPTACMIPTKDEIWFSWPAGNLTANNWTLVANFGQKTCDLVDAGFSAFCNYRRTPTGVGMCNETQSFFGASTYDYCIKEIGNVFYREYLPVAGANQVLNDPSEVFIIGEYITYGYLSIWRAELPLGFYDREKIVRKIQLDHAASDELTPPVFRLRLGNAPTAVDPNSEALTCSPQWSPYENKPIACPETRSNTQLASDKQRPSKPTQWNTYRRAKHLYFELVISDANGVAAQGGDVELYKFDFDATAMVKP